MTEKRRNFFPFSVLNKMKDKKLAKKKSEQIHQELIKEGRKRRIWTTNIIITGNSSTGKTSIIEQMTSQKIFREESEEAKTAMQSLRSLCLEFLPEDISSDYAKKLSHGNVQGLIDLFTNEIVGMDSCKLSVTVRKINEMAEVERYILENFRRILDPGFSMTFQDFVALKKTSFVNTFQRDVLKCPVTDLDDQLFNVDITHFRKPITGKLKLASHFDGTEIVMFCSSLQMYCHTELSAAAKAQLEEDLGHFKLLTTLPCFSDADFILFLTHSDIFEAQFDEMHLPKDFLDFCCSHELESHGPDEFYKYISSKFFNTFQNSDHINIKYRKLFRYTVNCVNCEDMHVTIKATLKLIADLFHTSRICGCCTGILFNNESNLVKY